MTGPDDKRLYPRLASFWAAVFLVVGLLFLFCPEALGHALTSLASLLHLDGIIRMPRDSIAYVLALSLMALLVFVTAQSARHPDNFQHYHAILVSKFTSTIFFMALAATHGSAWTLCALADGFVALTLFGAHRPWESIPADFHFLRKFTGQSPFYEVWFGKVWIAPQQAFWFRYTLQNGIEKKASTWAVLFHGQDVVSARNDFPLEDLPPAQTIILPTSRDTRRYRHHPQVFHVGENHLDNANALGSAGPLYWDLRWTGTQKPFTHGPAWVHNLGIARSRYDVCFPDLRLSGSISFPSHGKTQSLILNHAPGMIGHIYGTRQAESWAWVHCNMFDGAPQAFFEGLSARLPLTGQKPLSSFFFFDGTRRYDFSNTRVLLASHSRWDGQEWHFEARQGGATLFGIALLSPQRAWVEYTDTDGSSLWCCNSKLSSLTLKLEAGGQTREFRAHGTAAFEMISREKPESLR